MHAFDVCVCAGIVHPVFIHKIVRLLVSSSLSPKAGCSTIRAFHSRRSFIHKTVSRRCWVWRGSDASVTRISSDATMAICTKCKISSQMHGKNRWNGLQQDYALYGMALGIRKTSSTEDINFFSSRIMDVRFCLSRHSQTTLGHKRDWWMSPIAFHSNILPYLNISGNSSFDEANFARLLEHEWKSKVKRRLSILRLHCHYWSAATMYLLYLSYSQTARMTVTWNKKVRVLKL